MNIEQEEFLGILMLDTAFPRYEGDIGNPQTFDFPIVKKTINGAFPKELVEKDPSSFLPKFIDAAIDLQAKGAKIIATSCGFLTPYQFELEKVLKIPVLTSSLYLWQNLQEKHKASGVVGIQTISKSSLTRRHLDAAGIPFDSPIGSTESFEHFTQQILNNSPTLDFEKSEKENVAAAQELASKNPNLAAILLECTNMPPYADAISKATNLPVYSVNDGLKELWFH